MRFNQFNVIVAIANFRLVTSVTTPTIDSGAEVFEIGGIGEKLNLISSILKDAHTRVKRSWFSIDHSAALERRKRIMKTAGEFANDLKTLLSGKMPFVKIVPTPLTPEKAAYGVPPGISETQLRKLLKVPATAGKTGYLDNAVKKVITKKLNAGSLAAGAVGMLWPGPMAPVVSALLAPIVSDYLSSKNQNQ